MTRHQQAFTSFAEWHQPGDLLHPSILYPVFSAPTLTHFSHFSSSHQPPHLGHLHTCLAGWPQTQWVEALRSPEKNPPLAWYPGHGHGLHGLHDGSNILSSGAPWDCLMGEHYETMRRRESPGVSRHLFGRYFQQLSLTSYLPSFDVCFLTFLLLKNPSNWSGPSKWSTAKTWWCWSHVLAPGWGGGDHICLHHCPRSWVFDVPSAGLSSCLGRQLRGFSSQNGRTWKPSRAIKC